MADTLARDEAISMLSEIRVRKLTLAERESVLLDWWPIEEGDPSYEFLSPEIREEMGRSDHPERPAADPRYDEVLRLAIRAKFLGVRNSYLETSLTREDAGSFHVLGAEEHLEVCSCCGYRSLPERGVYAICPVCFWEDDGTMDVEGYSGPNHMTLKDARESFERIGAISEVALVNVEKDAKERYQTSRHAER